MAINAVGTATVRIKTPETSAANIIENGQDAPAVTGIVHHLDGSVTNSEAVIQAGQLYYEGAKEPLDIKENMEKKITSVASTVLKDYILNDVPQNAAAELTSLAHTELADISQAWAGNEEEAIALEQYITNTMVEVECDFTKESLINTVREEVVNQLKGALA